VVIPPIIVCAAPECWFYRSSEDSRAAGIPFGAKVFDGTGQRLEIDGADLSVVRGDHNGDDELAEILRSWLGYMDAIRGSTVDWPLHMLVRCSVEHAGWSDHTSVRRRKLRHWLIFVPRTLLRRAFRVAKSLLCGAMLRVAIVDFPAAVNQSIRMEPAVRLFA
jgi:hypothetical protein